MKPRSDAKLLNLPHDQQDRLCDWLLDGVETDEGRDTSYKAVQNALLMDYGVKSSAGALCEFYRQVCAPRRLRRASAAAAEFAGVTDDDGAGLVAVSKSLVRQKYFELLASGSINPSELNAFASAVSDFARGELEERKLKLKEATEPKKLELAERKVAVLESKMRDAANELQKLRDPQSALTDADRAAIVAKVDEILGIK